MPRPRLTPRVRVILLLLLFLGTADANTGRLYTKVSNLLPIENLSCFLEQHHIGAFVKFGCTALCQATPTCLLACHLINGDCRLYSSNVSPNWPGIGGGDPDTVNAACYSSWAERKDLAPDATFSTIVNPDMPAAAANDGFGCTMINDFYPYFLHSFSIAPWVVADLGSAKWVDHIVVQTRTTLSHFTKVEVRVGNDLGTASVAPNPILVYHEGPAAGDIVTLKGSEPLWGRYVSVQLLEWSQWTWLVIMEMKIIPP